MKYKRYWMVMHVHDGMRILKGGACAAQRISISGARSSILI